MKKFIFIIIIFCSSYYCDLFSWDTTAAKYLPLKLGNIWVYYGDYGQQAPPYQHNWFGKYRVIGTLDSLGKKYYKIQETIVQILGSVYFAVIPRLIRIDSVTMNILSFAPGCTAGEHTIDSLRSKKNDSISLCVNPPYNKDVCIDTSAVNIFGNLLPSKYFHHQLFEGFDSRKYTKTIGIVYEDFGCVGCGGNMNLIGCFIDSVLHGDTSMILGLKNYGSKVPDEYGLSQNYPNPFNPTTKIKFDISLPKNVNNAGITCLKIYDALGREFAMLVNEQLKPGTYEVNWDGTNYPSGIYFYRLESADFSITKKMILLK